MALPFSMVAIPKTESENVSFPLTRTCTFAPDWINWRRVGGPLTGWISTQTPEKSATSELTAAESKTTGNNAATAIR